MKKILLLWLFSGSLDSFSQERSYYTLEAKDHPVLIQAPDGTFSIKHPETTPDTLRAELLVTYTTRRWGVAHARDGYVVRKDGKVIRFLDDRKRRFPPNTRLWGWIVNDEKVRP